MTHVGKSRIASRNGECANGERSMPAEAGFRNNKEISLKERSNVFPLL